MKQRRKTSRSGFMQLSYKKVIGILFGIIVLWYLWKAWSQSETVEQYIGNQNFPSVLDDAYMHGGVLQTEKAQVSDKNGPTMPTVSRCDPKSGLCLKDGTSLPAKGLFAHGDNFYLDGKPFRILSGSFHYFRVHPSSWVDRLLKMKAAGLNTVTTYIPWNLHETVKNSFRFTGLWDLGIFIQTVHRVGLKLIIRPGPYICAEWEYGGLPSWLLRDTKMKIRSSYRPYLRRVEIYFDRLFPLLAQWQYSKGKGPIIAFQLENEFGSYGNFREDPVYMKFLLDIHKKWNIQELLLTSDGSKHFHKGYIPGVLETVNFHFNVSKSIQKMKDFQPNKPVMSGEYWAGWFDHWSEIHHAYNTTELEEAVTIMLKSGASINFYMFVGGTNWGFWNGANNEPFYKPTTTSYDYDAPISESGELKPKFHSVRRLIQEFKLGPVEWPNMPTNPLAVRYKNIKMKESMTYLEMIEFIDISYHKTLPEATSMELLDIKYESGQGYGWLLYRTRFTEGKTLSIKGSVRDRAQIILNGKVIRTFNLTHVNPIVNLIDIHPKENNLDILVENMGRANYKTRLNEERKGINGTVYIDQKKVTSWLHIPIEFLQTFCSQIRSTRKFKPFFPHKIPALYRAEFLLESKPQDTYLLMENWTKGIVLINGWNLGRYWNIGPQQSLYVPAALLKTGKNDVIVFELHGGQSEISFSDKHVWKTKVI